MKTRLMHEMRDGKHIVDSLWVQCPGCNDLHRVRVAAEGAENSGVLWEWDGDLELPTVSPSILCQNQWNCHSFLKRGEWQFLSDSQHALACLTVPMVDLPEWFMLD